MNIKAIIANKGYQSIIPAIDASINDFKKLDYSKSEIKETLRDMFYGQDSRIDDYLIMRGY